MCVCFGIADWWRKGSDTAADSGLEVANGFAGMGCSVAAIMAAVGTLMGFCRAGKPNLKVQLLLCTHYCRLYAYWHHAHSSTLIPLFYRPSSSSAASVASTSCKPPSSGV
jgi:predicted naringenin-chalcone synthase